MNRNSLVLTCFICIASAQTVGADYRFLTPGLSPPINKPFWSAASPQLKHWFDECRLRLTQSIEREPESNTSNATPFTVTSTADDRPIITYRTNEIDYRGHPLYNISFEEISLSKPHDGKKFWQITRNGPGGGGNSTVPLSEMLAINDPLSTATKLRNDKQSLYTLTYGECPPGYEETIRAEPLVTGHFYRVRSEVIKKIGPCKYEVIDLGYFLKMAEEYQQKIGDRSDKP